MTMLWHERGYWLFKDQETLQKAHMFDPGLANALCKLFEKQTVCDIGCGLGEYVAHLRAAKIEAEGWDGNPHTESFAKSKFCHVADFSQKVWLKRMFDWVLSLEVGEHIPRVHEDTFLRNLVRHASKGVVLSWATPTTYDATDTMGHVNSQPNDYIIFRMKELGFDFDRVLTDYMRTQAGRECCIHFRTTLMVFLESSGRRA